MGGSAVIRMLFGFVNPYEILDDPLRVCLTYFKSRIYNLGYSKMSVQTNIGLMEKTRVERKTKPKIREPCYKILINCLHWKCLVFFFILSRAEGTGH